MHYLNRQTAHALPKDKGGSVAKNIHKNDIFSPLLFMVFVSSWIMLQSCPQQTGMKTFFKFKRKRVKKSFSGKNVLTRHGPQSNYGSDINNSSKWEKSNETLRGFISSFQLKQWILFNLSHTGVCF